MDGFPSASCKADTSCGYLQAYETYGTSGQGNDTMANGTFYWGTGAKNVSTCKMSFRLEAYTQAWPESATTYYILGPNSNTFASRAAAFAGIPVPALPQSFAPGWGQ